MDKKAKKILFSTYWKSGYIWYILYRRETNLWLLCMPDMQGEFMNNIEQAISLLQKKGFPVKARAYGFSVQHSELAERDFGQCGYDNDSSISLSVNIDEDPPVAWFFRISFVEVAQFIIEAYQATGKAVPSRLEIIKSMRALDELYDDTDLDQIIESFLGEIEDE